jgi:hypothetical protein
MKKTTYITAILAAALFSGAAFAEMDNVDDILTGSGKVSASPSTPYVWVNTGSQDQDSDLFYNLEQINSSSKSVPFDKLSDDRDNRDSLRDNIS